MSARRDAATLTEHRQHRYQANYVCGSHLCELLFSLVETAAALKAGRDTIALTHGEMISARMFTEGAGVLLLRLKETQNQPSRNACCVASAGEELTRYSRTDSWVISGEIMVLKALPLAGGSLTTLPLCCP